MLSASRRTHRHRAHCRPRMSNTPLSLALLAALLSQAPAAAP